MIFQYNKAYSIIEEYIGFCELNKIRIQLELLKSFSAKSIKPLFSNMF